MHTRTHTLPDLERYKLLSTLLDASHRAEHNRILIKGAEIKKQRVHRHVQTAQVNWTDSKVLSPSPYSHILLIVHFTLQSMHVLLQLINLFTFCIGTSHSKKYTPKNSKRQPDRKRIQGVSQHPSNIISAHMWPLLTNVWNCICSHRIMATVCAAEHESAESTFNSLLLVE